MCSACPSVTALHVSCGQSLQTESLPLAKTGSIQASPPEGCMWKSTGKGHQVTFHLPAGIVPQGYCVCVFRSGVCHKLHSVSVQSIAGRLHNADRYAHTHTPVMYEIEILPYTVVSCVIHFICLPLPRHAPAVVMHSV